MHSVQVYLYAQRGMFDGAAAGLKLTILCMPSSGDGQNAEMVSNCLLW